MKFSQISAQINTDTARMVIAMVAATAAIPLAITAKTPTEALPVSSPAGAVTVQQNTPETPAAIALRDLAVSSDPLFDTTLQDRLDAEQEARDALQDQIDAEQERLEAEQAVRDAEQDRLDNEQEARDAALAVAEPAPQTPAAPIIPATPTIPTVPTPTPSPTPATPAPEDTVTEPDTTPVDSETPADNNSGNDNGGGSSGDEAQDADNETGPLTDNTMDGATPLPVKLPEVLRAILTA